MFTALLDTCVLVPSFLRDVLLEVAEAGVYRAVWSEAILDELEDTLLYLFDQAGRDLQESRSAAHRLRRQMAVAFPDAVVTEWEPLVNAYELPDPDDRHVLAAAVKGRADVIVTDNLKDFPTRALPADLAAQSADEFLIYALDLQPAAVRAAVVRIAARTGRTGPALSEDEIVDALERSSAVAFARELRRRRS